MATSGSQSNSRRRFSTAASSRMRVSASSSSIRLSCSRSSASCFSASARSVRSASRRCTAAPRGLGLAFAPRAQALGQRVAGAQARAQALAECLHRGRAILQLRAAALCRGLFVGPGRKALLDLGEAAGEQAPALVDSRGAHLGLVAEALGLGPGFLVLRFRRAPGPGGFALGRDRGVERAPGPGAGRVGVGDRALGFGRALGQVEQPRFDLGEATLERRPPLGRARERGLGVAQGALGGRQGAARLLVVELTRAARARLALPRRVEAARARKRRQCDLRPHRPRRRRRGRAHRPASTA